MNGWPQTKGETPVEACLCNKTSETVKMAMKDMFACHHIPERVIADNMPFNILKFKSFTSDWETEVVTSSRHNPKSNGGKKRADNETVIKES